MPTYLLDCSCGHPVPVDSSIAGGSTTCDQCGAELNVPSFRDLKQLPLAGQGVDEGQNASNPPAGLPSNRQPNLMRSLGAIILFFSLVVIAILVTFRVRAISGYTAEDAIEVGQQQIDSLNAIEAWDVWKSVEKTGLGGRDEMHLPAIEARRVQVLYTLMSVAGAIGFAGLVMVVLGGKKPESPTA